jgi:hypothetical protein
MRVAAFPSLNASRFDAPSACLSARYNLNCYFPSATITITATSSSSSSSPMTITITIRTIPTITTTAAAAASNNNNNNAPQRITSFLSCLVLVHFIMFFAL